jgi:hypothetical protein
LETKKENNIANQDNSFFFWVLLKNYFKLFV